MIAFCNICVFEKDRYEAFNKRIDRLKGMQSKIQFRISVIQSHWNLLVIVLLGIAAKFLLSFCRKNSFSKSILKLKSIDCKRHYEISSCNAIHEFMATMILSMQA